MRNSSQVDAINVLMILYWNAIISVIVMQVLLTSLRPLLKKVVRLLRTTQTGHHWSPL
jgi:hypothetical protein